VVLAAAAAAVVWVLVANSAFVLAAGVIGAVVGWRLARQPMGTLAWTGRCWAWTPRGDANTAVVSSLQVMVDLGSWVLVRGRWQGRSSTSWWVLAFRRDDDQALQWTALRAALYSKTSVAKRPPEPRQADPE
jgi:hypothetical protein